DYHCLIWHDNIALF
nr:immunoglobulin light chain junction region [Macaca mulatta]